MGPPIARRTKRLAARTATSNLRKARKATAYYRTSTNPTGEFQSESASKEKIRASVAYPKVIPWIKVQRPAVPSKHKNPSHNNTSFLVEKFIRMTDLTSDERDRYLSPQEQEIYQVQKIKEAERKKQKQQQQDHHATNTAHYLLEATSAYTTTHSSTFLNNNNSPGNLLPTTSHRRRCKRCLEHGTLEQALNCKGRSRRVFCLHFEENGMAKPKAAKKARTTTLETTATTSTTPTLS